MHADRLTTEQRHKNMAAIHAKDTKPELLVRKFLWSRGFRYRLNHPRLPGNLTSCCANTGLLSSSTVASGMGMKVASIL